MSSSFIARRWHTIQRAYVDSKNNEMSVNDTVKPSRDVSIPSIPSIPSTPPADGSVPLLNLPTELRLQIYSYLTENDKASTMKDFQRSFDLSVRTSTAYAYLWRRPGRLTKPNAISRQAIKLFQICHQMRAELIDACFNDRTFVLEASFYKQDVGGLCVLPAILGPTAWVKKLLIMTVVELDGKAKGIADLRPLQQMTNLKELTIVFCARGYSLKDRKADILERPDNVFKAILECLPVNTAVHFENEPGYARGYGRLESRNYWEAALESIKENLSKLIESEGKLSGGTMNHALCEYLYCQEGLNCVNSRVRMEISAPISLDDQIKAMLYRPQI